MKLETLIFDKVKKILPDNSDKNIFFVGITKTSQEVYFYSFINGEAVQCYTLAEQNILDENELSVIFSEVVELVKSSTLYNPDKYNIGTINIDENGINFDMVYHDMDVSEYRIQKKWKKDNIDNL